VGMAKNIRWRTTGWTVAGIAIGGSSTASFGDRS